MPRFYPDILFSDCWGSIGDKTFYHRKGALLLQNQIFVFLPGDRRAAGPGMPAPSRPGGVATAGTGGQRLWNKYAMEVPSQRPPYDPKTSISGYNLFVSAYHGFAKMGNEHVSSPRRKGYFPVFALDFLCASVLDGSHLLLRFRNQGIQHHESVVHEAVVSLLYG